MKPGVEGFLGPEKGKTFKRGKAGGEVDAKISRQAEASNGGADANRELSPLEKIARQGVGDSFTRTNERSVARKAANEKRRREMLAESVVQDRHLGSGDEVADTAASIIHAEDAANEAEANADVRARAQAENEAEAEMQKVMIEKAPAQIKAASERRANLISEAMKKAQEAYGEEGEGKRAAG